MKTSMKQEVELLDAMTDSGINALINWAARTQPGAAMNSLIIALTTLRMRRDQLTRGAGSQECFEREEIESAMLDLAEAQLEMNGRVWGRKKVLASKTAEEAVETMRNALGHTSVSVTNAYLGKA